MSASMSGNLDTVPERPQASMKSLMRLLPYARPFVWQFAGVLVLVAIYNATSVLQPYLVKVAIDNDISSPHPNAHDVFVIAVVYAVIVVIGLVANYVQIQLLQFSGQSVIRQIRLDLFTHIERQSMAFFDKNAIGRLVTNVANDTETVSQFFTQFFLSVVRDGLSIVMIVVAMFEMNVRIASFAMVLVPIIVLISLAFRSRMRRAYQTTRTRLSNIVAFLAENLAGMRMIQVFHQEPRQAREFDNLNTAHRKANVHEYSVSVMFNRTLELLGNLSVAAVVWLGGRSVLHGAIEFGTLYAFISYIQRFFQPINSVTQQWNTLQSSMVAAERIGRVLSVEPQVQDAPHPVDLASHTVQGRIEFAHVHFAYHADEPVLRDLSFTVDPGQFVGFVGATGAGKSSVMSLLARFYEPQEGVITLDGVDVRQYRQRDLHSVIGLVQQEVNLFTGTVTDNIRLFRQDISEQWVVESAKAVGAHEVILRLPNGYSTRLYGRGTNLSMGERQLISFARIVCLNPRVLILDEATANLDSHTEALVQRGLQVVAENRTTLVIAHRLSTVRHADRIFVLHHGCMVEQGTHAQLIQSGGLYANLVAKSAVEPQPSVI